jgi:hypothetical protein
VGAIVTRDGAGFSVLRDNKHGTGECDDLECPSDGPIGMMRLLRRNVASIVPTSMYVVVRSVNPVGGVQRGTLKEGERRVQDAPPSRIRAWWGARRMLRNALVNGLKPFIDRPFPLQEIGAAFKYYESQEHF